jgi:hypothetical protein
MSELSIRVVEPDRSGRNRPMNERPVADPIITALRLALAEIAARRAAESAAGRGKMAPTAKRKDTAA